MRAYTIFRGGWTGLLLGAGAEFAFVAVLLTSGVVEAIATRAPAESAAAIGTGLVLAAYATVAVPIGPALGLVCGLGTGALVTLITVPDGLMPWSGVAVAVAVWAVLWLVEPTGTIRALTRVPPVGSPALLFGCCAAALHAVLLRRWRSAVVAA